MFEAEVYMILKGKIGYYKMLVSKDKIRYYSYKALERPHWALCYSYMAKNSYNLNVLTKTFRNKYLKELDLVHIDEDVRLLKMIYIDRSVCYLNFTAASDLDSFIAFIYLRRDKNFRTLDVANLYHEEKPENVSRASEHGDVSQYTMTKLLELVNAYSGRSLDLVSHQPLYPNLFKDDGDARITTEEEAESSLTEKLARLDTDNEARIRALFSTTRPASNNWSEEQLFVSHRLFSEPQSFVSFCNHSANKDGISGHEGVYALNSLLESRRLRNIYCEWIVKTFEGLLEAQTMRLKNYRIVQDESKRLYFYNKQSTLGLAVLLDYLKSQLTRLKAPLGEIEHKNEIGCNGLPSAASKKSISKFSVMLKHDISKIVLFRNQRLVYITNDGLLHQIHIDFATRELFMEASCSDGAGIDIEKVCFLELYQVYIITCKSSNQLSILSYESGVVATVETGHESDIISIISSSQNNIVASVDEFCRIAVWNFLSHKKTLKLITQLDLPFKSVRDAQFVEDDKLLLICSETNEIRVYDYFNSNLVRKLDLSHSCESKVFWASLPFVFLAFVDKSKKLVVYDLDNQIVQMQPLKNLVLATFAYTNKQGFCFKLIIAQDKIIVVDLPLIKERKVISYKTFSNQHAFHEAPNVLLSLQDGRCLHFINFDEVELNK